MRRVLPPLVAALVVLGTLAAVPMTGLAAPTADTATSQTDGQFLQTETPANETNRGANDSDTPPGAQLAGVVGVGEVEIESAVDDRAFGIRVARAASDNARADVVADRLGNIETRLADLEDQRDALAQARENGSISEGKFKARAAALAARSQSLERAANQSAVVASGLPADLLESKGINVTAIRTLAERAHNVTGPEIAAIAKNIAGPNVGGPAAGDRTPFGGDGPIPDGVGPGEELPGSADRTGGTPPNSPDATDMPDSETTAYHTDTNTTSSGNGGG